MRQRCVGYAMKAMRSKFDLVAEAMRAGGDFGLRVETGHGVVQAVDVLPHFAGNAVTDGTGIFPGFRDALDDGAWVVAVEGEELEDTFGIRRVVPAPEPVRLARHADQRFPTQTVGLLG